MKVCRNCGFYPLPSRNRRYCAACSPLASMLWKRDERRRRAQRRLAHPSEFSSDSRDYWRTLEARRRYFREYMRRRRTSRSGRQAGGES